MNSFKKTLNSFLCAACATMVLLGCGKKEIAYEPEYENGALPTNEMRESSPPPLGIKQVHLLTTQGGRLDWSPDGNKIVFDRLGSRNGRQLYDIWISDLETGATQCLTCDLDGLPKGHRGNPAWHPAGDRIVFQAATKYGLATHPGAGNRNELWTIRIDKNSMPSGSQALLEITSPAWKVEGTLHPHFGTDHQGNSVLIWSHLVGSAELFSSNKAFGDFRIRMSAVQEVGAQLALAEPQEVFPTEDYKQGLYEVHGIKNGQILTSATPDSNQHASTADIILVDAQSQSITRRVTQSHTVWDEHAHLSPNTSRILFASDAHLLHGQSATDSFADYWVAKESGKLQRLTHFNNPEWEHRTMKHFFDPEKLETSPLDVFTGDGAFSPD